MEKNLTVGRKVLYSHRVRTESQFKMFREAKAHKHMASFERRTTHVAGSEYENKDICYNGQLIKATVGRFRRQFRRAAAAKAMMAKVGSEFGTLTYPHLIRPYSGYYDHLASQYRWGSLVPPYTLFVQ
jgi:hypothetical protein